MHSLQKVHFFRVHKHKREFRTPKTQYNGKDLYTILYKSLTMVILLKNTHLSLCLNHEYLKTKLNIYLKITTEITCIWDFPDGNFIKIIQEQALESFFLHVIPTTKFVRSLRQYNE